MTSGLDAFLDLRPVPVEMLALGEPTHGEPAFSRLRNDLLARLAARGFRSIAVESDRVAGLAVDAYVRGGGEPLDDVLATGFSHGLGAVAANRELLEWMRAHNRSAPPDEHLAFHGFDAPLEMTHAPAPGPYLRQVRDFLLAHLDAGELPPATADLDQLAADEARWSDPAAQLDAGRSVGRSPTAGSLRVLADDLLTVLYAQAPRLVGASAPGDWERARLHATTAVGLLGYHAVAADPAPPAQRTSRLLGVRDAWMARNLMEIRAAEQRRGPTLVFAGNRHLQRHPSTWQLAGMPLEWNSAGAIVSTLLGDRYVHVAGSLGASAALGLQPPAAGTFEGALGAARGQGPLFDAAHVANLAGDAARRTDVTDRQGYFPLDAAAVAHCDAVWHVDRFPADAADVAARILALPGVTEVQAGPESQAPEVCWDERFYFVGPDRRRPFATIVGHDLTGFDERSRLDRTGVFRLNVELGRATFERLFGHPPREAAGAQADAAAPDVLVPHPIYAAHGWASVVDPGPATQDMVDELLADAHRRAAERDRRRQRRTRPA